MFLIFLNTIIASCCNYLSQQGYMIVEILVTLIGFDHFEPVCYYTIFFNANDIKPGRKVECFFIADRLSTGSHPSN